jgi:hypothetical protein
MTEPRADDADAKLPDLDSDLPAVIEVVDTDFVSPDGEERDTEAADEPA